MKKRYLPFIVPNWIKWVLSIGLLLCILLVGYTSMLYQDIQKSKVADFTQSKELALTETDLTSVDKITRYHGETYYHVVSGTTHVGDEAIVYIPVNGEEQEILFYTMQDYITKHEVINLWEQNCSSCDYISANLAIDNNQPLWEIKYIDNKDRYVFEYFLLEDGTSYEHFRLQRSLY